MTADESVASEPPAFADGPVTTVLNTWPSAPTCEYEPIVELTGARTVGYEALPHTPGVTVAALREHARASGRLPELDDVTRLAGVREAAGWLGRDMLFVAMTAVPGTQARTDDPIERQARDLRRSARAAGLSTGQLVVEVTPETPNAAGLLERLRRMGFAVCLAEAGPDKATIDVVRRVQPEVVRLATAISDALPAREAMTAAREVVAAVHAYGGAVSARHLATSEQAEAAQRAGVDFGQGWYFGSPERPVARETAILTQVPTPRDEVTPAG